MKVVNNYILVEPERSSLKTKSGIERSEQYEEKTETGKVFESSNEKIKKGMRVLFVKYMPQEVKLENKDYLVIKEEDIIAIL